MKRMLLALSFLAVMAGFASAQESVSAARVEDPLGSIRGAYAEGRNQDLVILADRALLHADASAHGEIRFWRGAALRRLGRSGEALLGLDSAVIAGFDSPELHVERALVLSMLGRLQEASQEMETVRRMLQEDPLRREQMEGRWANREAVNRRFEARVRPQLGYDSNLVLIGDDATLFESADAKSAFYGAIFDAKLHLLEPGPQVFDVAYRNSLRGYSSESDLSSSDNALSLTGRTPLGDRMDLEIRLGFAETWLQGEGHFRTERSMGGALLFRPVARVQARLSLGWSDADYYLSGPDEQDRDGVRESVGLEATLDAGQGWSLTPYLALRLIDTDGTDYKGSEREVGMRVACPEWKRIQTFVSAGFVYAPFDKPHSLTAFAEEREDRRVFASASFVFPALEAIAGFAPCLTVRFEQWRSNIEVFEFRRWEPVLEFSVNLAF